ncbi:MAG TPA: 2-polyprenyl-3-methyl-6-methoxy-1,4-benzoquinone monooxygenase [Burkholderiales bacterium]
MNLDDLIVPLDRALRTLFAPAHSARQIPGEQLEDGAMDEGPRRLAGALMRVNHTGEICAQALYEGQLLVVRDSEVRALLARAANEEIEHLAWTERRIDELGARKSLLNPLFYAGSFALGAVAGLLGDRWSLGFLAETEKQVEQHLDRHLERLPDVDRRSRAIVEQMKVDENGHALAARRQGAAELPFPVRLAMRLASRVMTGTTRWL